VKKKVIVTIVAVILIALLVYSLIPVTVATSPKQMHNDQQYYAFGKIESYFSINNESVFLLNDSGTLVLVTYNGTTPPVGADALVHGTFVNVTIFGYSYGGIIRSSSVTQWYISM
jgi:hypothetical protein